MAKGRTKDMSIRFRLCETAWLHHTVSQTGGGRLLQVPPAQSSMQSQISPFFSTKASRYHKKMKTAQHSWLSSMHSYGWECLPDGICWATMTLRAERCHTANVPYKAAKFMHGSQKIINKKKKHNPWYLRQLMCHTWPTWAWQPWSTLGWSTWPAAICKRLDVTGASTGWPVQARPRLTLRWAVS